VTDRLLAALLDTLDDSALDRLAALLAPRIWALAPDDAPGDGTARLLTCSQAAQHAGTHIETIRRAVRSGALPAGRVGRSPRIDPADLDAWLRGGMRTGSTRPTVTATRARRPSARRRPLGDALAAMEPGGRGGVRSAATRKRPGGAPNTPGHGPGGISSMSTQQPTGDAR
jgi:excisionase family DNA binding protein